MRARRAPALPYNRANDLVAFEIREHLRRARREQRLTNLRRLANADTDCTNGVRRFDVPNGVANDDNVVALWRGELGPPQHPGAQDFVARLCIAAKTTERKVLPEGYCGELDLGAALHVARSEADVKMTVAPDRFDAKPRPWHFADVGVETLALDVDLQVPVNQGLDLRVRHFFADGIEPRARDELVSQPTEGECTSIFSAV